MHAMREMKALSMGVPRVRNIFMSWSLLKLWCRTLSQEQTHSGLPLNGAVPMSISKTTHPTPHSSTLGE